MSLSHRGLIAISVFVRGESVDGPTLHTSSSYNIMTNLRKISFQDDFFHTPVSFSVFHRHFQFVSFFILGSPQDRISTATFWGISHYLCRKDLTKSNTFSQIMNLSYLTCRTIKFWFFLQMTMYQEIRF